MTNLISVPDAYQGSGVKEKMALGTPRYMVQNPSPSNTPGPLPSIRNANVVPNRIQPNRLAEPVDEGLMSRQLTMKSLPPPYSPEDGNPFP